MIETSQHFFDEEDRKAAENLRDSAAVDFYPPITDHYFIRTIRLVAV